MLLAAFRNRLAGSYSLIGDARTLDSHIDFFQDINTRAFRFLGVFDKSFHRQIYANASASQYLSLITTAVSFLLKNSGGHQQEG
ncbi:hypothetical protein [Pseudomonas sp. TH31]|uniref:hypothetical protein n=1 Tax=Pseudomonas sp. TH31 TaxID=2796396 RepID=UPI00191289E6|nr:hypothetical protein [Pseudomonas sp. TH31]MBK5416178.1 hypothetical protein [Pseudomonas sp. TH31]